MTRTLEALHSTLEGCMRSNFTVSADISYIPTFFWDPISLPPSPMIHPGWITLQIVAVADAIVCVLTVESRPLSLTCGRIGIELTTLIIRGKAQHMSTLRATLLMAHQGRRKTCTQYHCYCRNYKMAKTVTAARGSTQYTKLFHTSFMSRGPKFDCGSVLTVWSSSFSPSICGQLPCGMTRNPPYWQFGREGSCFAKNGRERDTNEQNWRRSINLHGLQSK